MADWSIMFKYNPAEYDFMDDRKFRSNAWDEHKDEWVILRTGDAEFFSTSTTTGPEEGTNKKESKMSNVEVRKTMDEFSIIILAPGANAENTKISSDMEEGKVMYQVEMPDGHFADDFSAAFDDSGNITVPKEYSVEKLDITFNDGIIFIRAGVSSRIVAHIPKA